MAYQNIQLKKHTFNFFDAMESLSVFLGYHVIIWDVLAHLSWGMHLLRWTL